VAAGFLGTLLALSRIPVVTRALTAPGMASRLVRPHSFRVAGVVFLLYMAFGHLPGLFALPAGLGDIAAGIGAPLVARRLAQGNGRRSRWLVRLGAGRRPAARRPKPAPVTATRITVRVDPNAFGDAGQGANRG
jgi:hypothetical protein